MPREGIFVRVLQGGPLRAGDEVVVTAMGTGARGAGAQEASDQAHESEERP